MLPKILPKDKFDDFVGHLLTCARVAAPVARGSKYAFSVIESPQETGDIRMDYDVTILPPKKYLVPQYEDLVAFSGRGPEGAEALIQSEPTVLLGVHPYDLHAIATLDAAMSAGPEDPYYLAKRKVTAIIGLNISQCGENQFMADMGTVDAPDDVADVMLTDLGDRYYVELCTAKGKKLADGSGCCIEAHQNDHKARTDYDAARAANFTKKIPYDVKYLPELLNESYDSLLWDATARRCFKCGSCTNVCPTCYCFDVQDELSLDATSGKRTRKWDSCQLTSFAEVAGGENFREETGSRLRHRMFRKGKYILERTGRLGCVGCGRCISACVAGISILEAFQQIAADQGAEV